MNDEQIRALAEKWVRQYEEDRDGGFIIDLEVYFRDCIRDALRQAKDGSPAKIDSQID